LHHDGYGVTGQTNHSRQTISVIVPAHNAVDTIDACLDSLLTAVSNDDEVIVIDDGSTDTTTDRVEARTDPRIKLVRCGKNIGRGPARNRGARQARGSILAFVDADVIVHPHTIDKIRYAFERDGVTAMIGSYDDSPADPGLISQFRNLLHHHVHQHAKASASHFWTGLGAVSAAAFVEVGEFDEGRWARDMEDVELGHRLVDAGIRIAVRPDVQGCHLKRYTLKSMIQSDLINRAIPWTQLSLSDHRSDRFVTSPPQMISAVAASVMVIGLLFSIVFPPALLASAAALLLFLLTNLPVWRTLARRHHLIFVLACVPLMFIHVFVAVVGGIVGGIGGLLHRR